MNLIIRQVGVEDVYRLRHQILRPDQSDERVVLEGDELSDTAHFAAFIGDQQVGIVSVCHQPVRFFEDQYQNSWRIRAMGVVDAYQHQGIGRVLLATAMDYAKEMGADIIWCDARAHAIRFYEKSGFKVASEEFEVPEVGPHYVMLQ